MNGHLHLICARNTLGDSHLREQSFRAPFHISKPSEDEGALVVNIASPTAGLFDDDVIDVAVRVESGASLLLTTPAATRLYGSRHGGHARVRQVFDVREGATLEYFPEPFIPHAGARLHQSTELRAAADSTVIFFEWLAPGRSASGERFQFAELAWDMDFRCDGHLAARERYTLRPGDESLAALLTFSATAHYLGCFLHGIKPDVDAIHALASEDVYVGCSALPHGGWVIKALCRDSLPARQTLQTLRSLLHQARGTRPPWTGRF